MAEKRRRQPPVRVSGFVQIDWVIHNPGVAGRDQAATGAAPEPGPLHAAARARARRRGAGTGLRRARDGRKHDQRPAGAPDRGRGVAAVAREAATTACPPHGDHGPDAHPLGSRCRSSTTCARSSSGRRCTRPSSPARSTSGCASSPSTASSTAAVAVMNGNPHRLQGVPGSRSRPAKDLVGRIGVDFEIAPGVRVQAGVSARHGHGLSSGDPRHEGAAHLAGPERRRPRRAERDHRRRWDASHPVAEFHRFGLGATRTYRPRRAARRPDRSAPRRSTRSTSIADWRCRSHRRGSRPAGEGCPGV